MKFPFSDQSWKLLVRSSRERAVLVSYIEEKICSQVLLEPELEASLLSEYKPSSWNESKPDILYAATRLEKLKRFKRAAFLLQVEEFYSKTRSLRENIIFSMLRCSSLSRLKELSLAIQEVNLTLPQLQFAGLKVQKVLMEVALVPSLQSMQVIQNSQAS